MNKKDNVLKYMDNKIENIIERHINNKLTELENTN